MKASHASAILLVGLACTKSPEPPAPKPHGGGTGAATPDASKGPQVNSYIQGAAVDAVKVAERAAIEDFAGAMLAYAPDGQTWATAWGSGARLFQGDQELAAVRLNPPDPATAIGFSADGAALYVGYTVLDATTGAAKPQIAMDSLATWAAAAGKPAPPKLSSGVGRMSDDGTLLVLAASGITRDRRAGQQAPKTGDVDWLIALDGVTRKPTEVLWHGNGVHTAIAISADHVAAGGLAAGKVFERKALTQAIDLGGAPPGIHALAWSPDGALLAATGAKQIVLWRAGAWDKPAASWEAGSDYQSTLAFHPARPVLLVGNRDGHLRLYGVADGQLPSPPLVLDHDAGGVVSAAAFRPDGGSLLAIVRRAKNEVLRFDVTLTP